MIKGINHITLSVKDLNESFKFYTEILSFKPICKGKKVSYLLAGKIWIALIKDTHTRKKELPEYTHIAFDIEEKNFRELSNKIISYGAKIFQENTSEGLSLYFLDPNGHKLEIHASTLEDRIKAIKEKPYEDMIFFV